MSELSDLLTEWSSSAEAAPASVEARITAAALELFAERSYEAATTQAIAKRAGVTERTLFKHFKNKESLFVRTAYPALLKLLRPVALGQLRRVLEARGGEFRATIRSIVEERVSFALKHPAVVKLVAQEILLRPAFRQVAFKFITEEMGPTLEAFFADARATGQMRDVPTSLALRTLVSNVLGFVVARIVVLPEAGWDDEREVGAIADLILDGLAAPATRTGPANGTSALPSG